MNARRVAQFHVAQRHFLATVKGQPSTDGALVSPQNQPNFLFRSEYEPFRSQPASVVSSSLLDATDLQAIEAKSWWRRALVNPRPNVQLCGQEAPWPEIHVCEPDE